MKPRLLIIGAGYIGQALADRVQSQWDVFTARRSPREDRNSVVCDVSRPETLKDLPDVDAIFYAVAADESSDEAYKKAYADGLGNVLAAYARRRPRFILASSTSVYAENQGGWVHEDDGVLVTTGPSRFIVEGEKALLASGFPGAILRFGGLYGPGRTAFARRILNREEPLSRGVSAFANRTHRDDAIGIAAFLLDDKSPAMRVINAVDSEPAGRNEVILWMLDHLGMDRQGYPEVEGPVKGLHRGHKRISNERIRKLGYSFLYPSYREGYAALLKEES